MLKIWMLMTSLVVLALGGNTLPAQETKLQYLSGQGKDEPVKWQFYCTEGRNSGRWTTIDVPSNWELEGFGTYNYGHDDPKASEQGRYRHSFEMPGRWRDKTIFIVFEGVMTDTEVWINGKS
ncbi:MAG: sugar-binding domain-containing protein, partial [Planctomycetota bacterium]